MTDLPKAPPLSPADLRKPVPQHNLVRLIWPTIGLALFTYGIAAGKWWVGIIGFLVLLVSLGATLNRRDDRILRAARSGAVRVETIKQTYVNQKVQQYARAGWAVEGQSSAKSLGSQARVTITFRKR